MSGSSHQAQAVTLKAGRHSIFFSHFASLCLLLRSVEQGFEQVFWRCSAVENSEPQIMQVLFVSGFFGRSAIRFASRHFREQVLRGIPAARGWVIGLAHTKQALGRSTFGLRRLGQHDSEQYLRLRVPAMG
jgi:hypothetical protein